jgi:hypothetical protein
MNTEDVTELLMDMVIDHVSLVDGVREFNDVGINPGSDGFIVYLDDGTEFQVTVVKSR